MGNPLNSNPNRSIGAAGFERGKIAEIWGPTGAGKTAIAFQAAVEAIKAGGRVAWIGKYLYYMPTLHPNLHEQEKVAWPTSTVSITDR